MAGLLNKKIMKICLVSREYPPETGFGGIGTYTYELAQGLAELGHEVHVIAKAVKEESDYKDQMVHVHRIKERMPWGLRKLKNMFPVELFFYSIRVAQKIHELTEEYGIEVVEVPEWEAEGFWYSFSKKIPMIIKFHTPFFVVARLDEKELTIKRRIIMWLEKTVSKRSDFFSSPSRQMAEIISKEYGIDLSRIRIAPLPINTDFFKPSGAKKILGKNVLFTGRLEVRKGVGVLADAIPLVFKEMPEATFTFIGKDNYSERFGMSLKDLILKKSGKPLQVTFHDHMSRGKLMEYYRESSLCVIPSVWENFGYTVLEAMACGTPVVTTDKVGITEYFDQGGVVKVPSENAPALAQAIISLLKNEELLQKLRTKARMTAELYFSRAAVSRHYERYYEDILEEVHLKSEKKHVSCLKPVRN